MFPIDFSKFSSASLCSGAILATATLVSAPEAKANTGSQMINCPLTKARRTITDELPESWWTTPLIANLTEAKVTKIAGKTVLQCIYGAAGRIQRYAPDGTTCYARRNRYFICRKKDGGDGEISNPGTYSTGPINIRQTYLADLDSGKEQSSGADIWFEAETKDLLYVVPRNNARLGVGDRSNRGYAGCSRARYNTSRVSLKDIPVGSYVCVRTSEGRVSQFRVNAVTGGSGPKTLRIGYTTWRKK